MSKKIFVSLYPLPEEEWFYGHEDKSVYSPNEKTVLNVSVTDKNDSPIHANMSLTAVDASALTGTAADPPHVRSYLLLESELNGVVENPGYYFNEEHANRHRKYHRQCHGSERAHQGDYSIGFNLAA